MRLFQNTSAITLARYQNLLAAKQLSHGSQ